MWMSSVRLTTNCIVNQTRCVSLTAINCHGSQKWGPRLPRYNIKVPKRVRDRMEQMRYRGRAIAHKLKLDLPPTISALDKCAEDEPLSVGETQSTPYIYPRPTCVLCKYDVKLDYKNTRLLSQFVSSFSGRIYEQHVTGLCLYQYEHLRVAIITARRAGLMPIIIKNPRYLRDPKLFDPMRPIKPNSV